MKLAHGLLALSLFPLSAIAEVADFTVPPSVTTSQAGRNVSRKQQSYICRDTRTGGIITGAHIVLALSEGDDDGGHVHPGRPLGRFSPTIGDSNSSGYFATTYEAPEAAGRVRAALTCSAPGYATSTSYFNIDVKFQDAGGLDFVELPGSTYYSLVGETGTHPNNHFGTSVFVAQLQTIASRYHEAYPQAPILAYNDMSIKWGGIFDINANWQPDHYTHRFGSNVDLRVTPGAVPVANRTRLAELIRLEGLQIHPELARNHWHLY